MFGRIALCFALLVLLPDRGYGLIRAKVGVLSSPDDDLRQYSDKFWSLGRDRYPGLVLVPLVERIDWWNPLQVTRAVCRLGEKGATSLLALNPSGSFNVLTSLSDHLGLPLLHGGWSEDGRTELRTSLLPDTTAAISDVLKNYGWNDFAFFYDSDEGPDQLQKVLQYLNLEPRVEGIWRVSSAEDATRIFNTLQRNLANVRILLATSESLADDLVAKLAGSSTAGNAHFVLLRPVGVADESPMRRSSVLLTKLTLAQRNDPALSVLENRWTTIMPQGKRNTHLSDQVMMSYDASLILHAAYSGLLRDNPGQLGNDSYRTLNCSVDSPEHLRQDGIRLAVSTRQVTLDEAVTGSVHFDDLGKRKNYTLHVIESAPVSQRKIGTWSESGRLQLLNKSDVRLPDIAVSAALQDVKRLIVTSILNPPFLMRRPDGSLEGYVVDLVAELNSELGWELQLKIVNDGKYGFRLPDGSWTGMIGELVRNISDFAIADLTKTPMREAVVDFSTSFITSGLSILMKKPDSPDSTSGRLGPFFFLSVWSYEIWLLFLLMVIVFSMVSYVLARYTGAPERIRALSTKDSDRLSPCSSLWFVAGSMLMRDTGIFPKSLSHRLCMILWWSFCLFMTMAYIASLVDSLVHSRTVVTTTHARITSHDLLKQFIETGYPVIGTLKGGSTEAYFKNSQTGNFRDYGRYISEHPEIMTTNYNDGALRVHSSGGDYAFIMESHASEYISNRVYCDTIVATGHLDTRNFAVTMKKGSPHRLDMDDALLSLMEKGVLRKLYEKWWYNSSANINCEDPNLDILPTIYNTSLTLHEVSGVFYIWMVFVVLSVITAAAETKRRKVSLRT